MGGVLRWAALLVVGLMSCFVLGYAAVLLIRGEAGIAGIVLLAASLVPAGLLIRALVGVWRVEARRPVAVRAERVPVPAADPDLADVSIWDVRRPTTADSASL